MQIQGGGLAGLVEAQLGLQLDKRLQCSSWSQRPLSGEQIRYAASDAAVLLLLLDSFLAAAFPDPATPPSSEDNRSLQDGRSGQVAADASPSAGEHGGSSPDRFRVDSSERPCASACQESSPEKQPVIADATALVQSMHGLSIGSGRTSCPIEQLGACSPSTAREAPPGAALSRHIAGPQAVSMAAENWGSRLEVGGYKAASLRPRSSKEGKILVAADPADESLDFGASYYLPRHRSARFHVIWPLM